MSGRTLGIQSSWHEVFRTLGLDIEPSVQRKSTSIADSINQQLEEFINRYTVRATNDDGDVTFDAAGTYTFQGDVVIDGDLQSDNWVSVTSGWRLRSTGEAEFNGDLDINGDGSIDGDFTVTGTLDLDGTGSFQTESTGERLVIDYTTTSSYRG